MKQSSILFYPDSKPVEALDGRSSFMNRNEDIPYRFITGTRILPPGLL